MASGYSAMKRLVVSVIALLMIAVPALALNAHQGHLKDRLDNTRRRARVHHVKASDCLTHIAQKHANRNIRVRVGAPFHHLTYKIRKACGTKGHIQKSYVSAYLPSTTYDGCYNYIYRQAYTVLVRDKDRKVGIGAAKGGTARACVFIFKGLR